jgi:hypothetical protein
MPPPPPVKTWASSAKQSVLSSSRRASVCQPPFCGSTSTNGAGDARPHGQVRSRKPLTPHLRSVPLSVVALLKAVRPCKLAIGCLAGLGQDDSATAATGPLRRATTGNTGSRMFGAYSPAASTIAGDRAVAGLSCAHPRLVTSARRSHSESRRLHRQRHAVQGFARPRRARLLLPSSPRLNRPWRWLTPGDPQSDLRGRDPRSPGTAGPPAGRSELHLHPRHLNPNPLAKLIAAASMRWPI